MKKLLVAILALIIALVSVSGLAETQFDGQITIGIITGITGAAALGGERATKGVTLAAEQINAAGGVLGKELVIQIEDDGGTQAGALNVMNKLIGDGAAVVIGPLLSTNVIACEQAVREAGIPNLVLGTSPTIYDLDNPYIFRIRPSDTITAGAAAQFMYENLGLRKIGLLTNTEDHGTGALDVMMSYYNTKDDVEIVQEPFNVGDRDLTAQLLSFNNSGVEGIIYWGHEAEVTLLARQVEELGIDTPILTSASLPQVLNAVTAEQIDGWYVAIDMSITNETSAMKQYVEDFQARWGELPELHSSAYYGGVMLAADAITRAGSTDSESICRALRETKDFEMVLGNYTWHENNDMLSGCVVIQYDSEMNESVAASVTVE